MTGRAHPYVGKPDYQFWKNASGSLDAAELDPVTAPKFQIDVQDRVVTAGSCFAQHVARHLTQAGLNHHVTEPGHAVLPPEVRTRFNYGVFSARYGNIYTTRQLLQLLRRAYSEFDPLDALWEREDGRAVDPFRPQIQPDGFFCAAEARRDRNRHLAAVRRAVEDTDVFVFTLGLTEAWGDRRDGAVYPLAPGVAGGVFDPERHVFHNFGPAEVAADLEAALGLIRAHNPRVRVLLTVSPVPLNATAVARHVVVSTAYSKAVLRVAAEQVCANAETVDYFPSYEIITAPQVRGRYFAADARSVLEEGVEHVMGVFFRHYCPALAQERPATCAPETAPRDRHLEEMETAMAVLCDEELISGEAVPARSGGVT